ncbi:MAG: hypothetical protein Q9210_002018 [Variospora velana]
MPSNERTAILTRLIAGCTFPKATDLDDNACHICREDTPGPDGAETPINRGCGHILGMACLTEWMFQQLEEEGNLSPGCPVCRTLLLRIGGSSQGVTFRSEEWETNRWVQALSSWGHDNDDAWSHLAETLWDELCNGMLDDLDILLSFTQEHEVAYAKFSVQRTRLVLWGLCLDNQNPQNESSAIEQATKIRTLYNVTHASKSSTELYGLRISSESTSQTSRQSPHRTTARSRGFELFKRTFDTYTRRLSGQIGCATSLQDRRLFVTDLSLFSTFVKTSNAALMDQETTNGIFKTHADGEIIFTKQ